MSMVAEISALRAMRVRELRERYFQVFGEVTRSNNKGYLWKRVAYGIQAKGEGGLSERAQARAAELARDADVRVRGCVSAELKARTERTAPALAKLRKRDPRLPPAGTILYRDAYGVTHEVLVLEDAFMYGGATYRSLSAVAIKIAGVHCNGFAFFGLSKPWAGAQ